MAALETRPTLSENEFEAALKRERPSHWLTGVERFIYVPEVMNIEGWRLYGSAGNRMLTMPQRYLMMWSDIVGQTENGGLAQFFENYANALDFAPEAVVALDWPDLRRRFEEAFVQYICDHRGRPTTIAKWLRDKKKQHDELQIQAKRLWRKNTGKPFQGSQDDLDGVVSLWAVHGLLKVQQRSCPDTEAFNKWFYSQSTRDASEEVIGRFVRAHKNELVRIAD